MTDEEPIWTADTRPQSKPRACHERSQPSPVRREAYALVAAPPESGARCFAPHSLVSADRRSDPRRRSTDRRAPRGSPARPRERPGGSRQARRAVAGCAAPDRGSPLASPPPRATWPTLRGEPRAPRSTRLGTANVARHDAADERARSRRRVPLAQGTVALPDVVNRRDERVPTIGPHAQCALTRAARRVRVGGWWWWWTVARRSNRG